MELYELEIEIDEMVTRFIRDLPSVNAREVGLDERCGNVIVGEDFIGVNSYNDARLQYYGGFEYVSKEQRKQYGDWVFYTAESDDDRVAECLERFNEKEEA
jgi:hypothetical protein